MAIAGAGMRGDVLGRGVAVGMRKARRRAEDDVRRGHQGRDRRRHDREASEKWFKIDMTPQT